MTRAMENREGDESYGEQRESTEKRKKEIMQNEKKIIIIK